MEPWGGRPLELEVERVDKADERRVEKSADISGRNTWFSMSSKALQRAIVGDGL